MRLQEPDKAVLAYQDARKLEEKLPAVDQNSDLAGNALTPKPQPRTPDPNA
jgi:hypothetical protein